jgi:hypothetical protein
MVHEVGEIAPEQFGRVRTGGFVRCAMAATIIDQHRGFPGQSPGYWQPKGVVHRKRMNE